MMDSSTAPAEHAADRAAAAAAAVQSSLGRGERTEAARRTAKLWLNKYLASSPDNDEGNIQCNTHTYPRSLEKLAYEYVQGDKLRTFLSVFGLWLSTNTSLKWELGGVNLWSPSPKVLRGVRYDQISTFRQRSKYQNISSTRAESENELSQTWFWVGAKLWRDLCSFLFHVEVARNAKRVLWVVCSRQKFFLVHVRDEN